MAALLNNAFDSLASAASVLTPTQWLLVAVTMLLSSLIQGTVGFASGLFSIPLLVLSGIGLPQAIAINIMATAVQNISGWVHLRADVKYDIAWVPILIRLIWLPIGAALLAYLAMQKSDLKQAVGFAVLLLVLSQWIINPRPQAKVHSFWTWSAFSASGFLLGFCGMGGPPMVLWIYAHDWTAKQGRAFLFYLFAVCLVPHALVLSWFFGAELFAAMGIGLAVLPLVLLGTRIGLSLGNKLPKEKLRTMTLVLLLLVALWALLEPWVFAPAG